MSKKSKREPTVKYIVDSSNRGTHKTVEEAMNDAAENPKRTTLITIRPHITLENFNVPR